MDWEVGLDEYFDWYQLPEGRPGLSIFFSECSEATPLREKYVPACYRPMIIDEWQHLRQEEGTVAEYIARF